MINSAKWRGICKKVLERDFFKCRLCSNKEGEMNVHHIIPWCVSKDNSLKNLVTLCKGCHKKLENKFLRYGLTHYMEKMIIENEGRMIK